MVLGIVQKSHYESQEQWIEKIRAGDKDAFGILFQRYFQDLHRFIWGYVKREDIAEELVQDVYIKIWEQRHLLDSSKSIKAFLYRIARNLAIDFLRHQKTVNEWQLEKKALYKYSFHSSFLDDRLSDKMVLKDVQEAIERLPERQRLIFILSRYNQLTYVEIARFLNISVNTVETQIVRALKKLRDEFSSIR